MEIDGERFELPRVRLRDDDRIPLDQINARDILNDMQRTINVLTLAAWGLDG